VKLLLRTATIIGGVALLLAIVFSYFYFPLALVWAVSTFSAPLGFEIEELELESVSSSRLSFSKAVVKDSNAGRILRAENIELGFTLTELLSRPLKSIKIESLLLQIPEQDLTLSEPEENTTQTGQGLMANLSSLPFDSLTVSQFQIESPPEQERKLWMQGEVRYDDGIFTLSLNKQSFIRLQKLPQIPTPLTLRLEEGVTLKLDSSSAEWELSESNLHAEDLNLLINETEANIPQAKIRLKATGVSLKNYAISIEAEVPTCSIRLNSNNIQASSISLRSTLTQAKISTTISTQLDNLATEISAEILHDIENNSGNISYRASTNELQKLSASPLLYPQLTQQNIHFTAGSLRAEGSARWADSTFSLLPVTLGGESITGTYSKTPFSGAKTNSFSFDPNRMKLLSPLELRVEKIGSSLEVKDIQLNLESYDPKHGLGVNGASAKIFDGVVSLPKTQVHFGSPTLFALKADKISLSKILSLYEDQGVSGTGALSATLPLQLGEDGIKMESGIVWASGPGKIRFASSSSYESLASNNAGVGFVLKAMKNYHYSSLSAVAEYEKDGNLHASVALKGHNPDLASSQPLHLNVSVEQNVLSLLRSLQIPSNIERSLAERNNSRKSGRKNRKRK